MANFSELDRYLFGQATHYEIYRKLGAHFTDQYGIRGVCFDVWAPNAARIWVIGSFNGWDETADEMTRLEPDTMGIFELFIPGIEEGALYKYLIETKDGKRLYKADPYANYAELRPGTASAVTDIEHLSGPMKMDGRACKDQRYLCKTYGDLRGTSGILDAPSGQRG